MKTDTKIYIILLTAFVLFMVIGMLKQTDNSVANQQRMDFCVDWANRTGIDVNDTDVRAEFIKKCFETK